MKIVYFDCLSGISGDMTLGALVDAGVPIELLDYAIQSLGVPELRLEAENVHRHAMRAIQVHVHCPHEHKHRHLSDILAMIDTAFHAEALTSEAAELAKKIFTKLAAVEANVHGVELEKVHFHEVGAADSIADIVGAAVGLDYLKPDVIFASAVPTGTGVIKIAHGLCSVPAPATAELLRGIPIAASQIPFELTTPTGAAILATTVKAFLPLPSLVISHIGYGAGGRDLPEQANLLRLVVGEIADNVKDNAVAEWEKLTAHYHSTFDDQIVSPSWKKYAKIQQETEPLSISQHKPTHTHEHEHGCQHREHCCEKKKEHIHGSGETISEYKHDEVVWVLETNLDDMTGEMIGYCIEKLWKANPLDVYTAAIQMKKQRPGVKLTILCQAEQLEEIETILFEHTTTLGVRRVPVFRDVLQREQTNVETRFGTVAGKIAVLRDGTKRFAPEYESAKQVAETFGVTLDEIYTVAKIAFPKTQTGKI
ncbi:MAG: LarC family nickel insertion protein [Planctomycetaceae bacterium]|jgi:uncharacterized protein (DUF111 family)|nr:LarC family nickel insertion protein [Planctomycetaceae bacterium]